MKRILSYLFVASLTTLLISCGNKNAALSGAGATFPAPYYNIVFKNYATETGTPVTYGAVGSGGGIRSLKDKTADFGATDVFLSDDELAEMKADIVHVPTALGAVVLSYNLEGVTSLNLNASVLSDIYRGVITKWDDERIKAINPGVNFPNQAITPIYRSDGSGTTYVFSDYMSKVDSLWLKDIGRGKALNFPAGIAAKGNPGVAGIVAETKGSLGYIGSEYASALSLPAAKMQNSSGNYVEANEASISASANVDMPDDTRLMITNSTNESAYPISTFTWIIVYKEQFYNDRAVEQASNLVNLLNYMTDPVGQDIAAKTHYAPLSGVALEKTKAAIKSITYNRQQILKDNK